MQHGEQRTDLCPWFIDPFFQLSSSPALSRDSVVSTLSPETTRSESTSSQARGDLSPEPTETEKKKKTQMRTPIQNG